MPCLKMGPDKKNNSFSLALQSLFISVRKETGNYENPSYLCRTLNSLSVVKRCVSFLVCITVGVYGLNLKSISKYMHVFCLHVVSTFQLIYLDMCYYFSLISKLQ